MLCGLFLLTTGCTNPASQSLASLSITASPSTVAVGGAVVLKATAHLSDGTTQDVTSGTLWSLSNTSLATVGNGAITAKAPGTLTVQAAYLETTPAGNSPSAVNVSPQNLSASTQVTITPATGGPNVPVVSWTPPAAISYGTALSSTQLNATANVAGTFAYTPAQGTILPAGTQTLSVLFTPNDTQTYSSATATVSLTVNQATPVITWPTPAAVAAGSALSATQLDATANVPGSFAYTPAAGTVLTAGTQTLTAVFSPTDATDYSSATAQASLVVNGPSGPVGCGGPTVNLNSGASQSTIQSTISGAAQCAVIVFAAGTYGPITSTIRIPCGVSLSGPTVPYSQTPNQTATINGSSSFIGWAFQTTPGCSQSQTIQYLAWDGKQPGGNGGGGFLEINPGTTNLTVQNNWLHGVNAPSTDGGGASQNIQANLINFGGGPNGAVTQNVNILYNIFGGTSNSDCKGAITEVKTEDGGGYCNGVGIGANVANVSIQYNIFHWLEQGMKFYEGQGDCNPLTVSNNDYSHIQRIMYETQCNFGGSQPTLMTIQYNSFHDRGEPGIRGQQNYDLSVANGCTIPNGNNPTNCVSHVDYNVFVQTNATQADVGIEVWGGSGTTANYNYLQGYLFNGITWSASGQFTFNKNNFNLVNNGTGTNCATGPFSGFWNRENNGETATPNCAGNTFSNAITGTTPSVAPTLSPAGGTFSGSQVVTITNPGTDRDTNTTDWCTTDGSTPIPGSGTAVGYYNGGTITITGPTTVQCVGMWGALNQPYSYPSGYGYVPSAMVSSSFSPALAPARSNEASRATVTSSISEQAVSRNEGAAVGLTSVTILPSQVAVAVGSNTQLKAIASFSDGSTKDVSTQFAWVSSDTRSVSVSPDGLLSGVATGKATITGSYLGIAASVAAASSIGSVTWSGPIVITTGGTYSGNWQSTDSEIPAVTVATTAPVIIENAHLRSVTDLIKSAVAGADLTIRNSVGVALNPATKGQANGLFLKATSPARLDVEGNYIENASGGVLVQGYSGNRDGQQAIVIRRNRARNLNGLLSDGKGGYLPVESTNGRVSRFIELDDVQAVPGIDLGWNEVMNYPGVSLVTDNIDVRGSSGTVNQPLEIHDTYIQGWDAYSGGGIKTESAPGATADVAPAFNSIHDNQVVGTVNYGIEFAGGHDNVAANNRVISSGLLTDGTKIEIAAPSAGIVNNDSTNTMHDNIVAWNCWNSSCSNLGYRKDQYFPASPGDYSSNSVLAHPPTLETEEQEYLIWLDKMSSSGVSIGPRF
jgi:hypothetical protein